MKFFVVVLALVFATSANAQFSGLGNKLKNKVEKKVENEAKSAEKKAEKKVEKEAKKQVKKAENEAKKQVNLAVEYKTQLNAPKVDEKSDIDELYEALDYWCSLEEMGLKKKDVEWLTSDKGERYKEIYNIILNRNDKGVARFNSFETAQTRFQTLGKSVNEFLYNGEPKPDDTNETLAKRLKWYVDKAKKGKTNAKRYYTVNGGAIRYLSFTSKRYTDTPEIQKQTAELCKLWDQVDSEYQAKFPNCNPHLSYDEVIAKYEQEQAERKKKAEAAKAARKKEIEAKKETLKPGALNKTMNAKVLKLAKERVPECVKVVVESSSWDVKREYGSIVRRVLIAWVITKDNDGNLVAHDYGFAQEYLGGGKYGELRNYSVGLRSKYVK